MTKYRKDALKARTRREAVKAIDQQVNRLRSRFGLNRSRLKRMRVLDKTEALSVIDQEGRKGAEAKVQDLLEAEVDQHLTRQRYQRKPDQPLQGYRNGHAPARTLATRCGPITVRLPKLRDLQRPFRTRLLARRQSQTSAVADFLPDLYLAGLSLGDFELFLREFLGDGASLSASHIARLKAKWEVEYQIWVKRPVSAAYAYLWADGIYLRVGTTSDRLAVLVVIGVTAEGKKELLAVEPGYRESAANWQAVFGSLRERGLQQIALVIGDGCPGLWQAVDEYYWAAGQQLCWQHKKLNVLARLPDRLQTEAKTDLNRIRLAPTRAQAVEGFIRFAARYRDYGPAVETLLKDQDRLLTFYNFPKAHWASLRTTNAIESTFAPVRTRLNKAKRVISLYSGLALVQQLLLIRESRLNRLAHGHLAATVMAGRKYQDGVAVDRRTRKGKSSVA